jgi:hypothetical protein
MLSRKRKHQYEALERAKADIFEWAKVQGIKLCHMEFVPLVEENNGGHTTFFYETDADLDAYSKNDISDRVINQYFCFLKMHGYSDDDIKRNAVYFDSDETVKKKFGGSYFARMR